MPKAKIVSIVGARPQFIKAAVVSRAFSKLTGVEEVIVHTGQHFDASMSQVFFDELEIPAPRYNLAIPGGQHGRSTGRMLEKLEGVLITEQPDAVIIYGDTNSTLAGALAAAKLHILLAHVEAGLRSHRLSMAEEINRRVADRVSNLLLCPTRRAVDNLAAEGVNEGVRFVGDVMYDATLFARAAKRVSPTPAEVEGLRPGGFGLATLHRAENVRDPAELGAALEYLVEQSRALPLLFAVHPATHKAINALGWSPPSSIRQVEPLGFFDLHAILDQCVVVFTDSGGLQKEAYFHRRPCVTMRSETEWVETIDSGWNRLWSSPDWVSPRRDIADYGDGHAGEAIVREMMAFIGAATA